MGDLLVVSSCNGMIRALDNKTGKVKWSYDIRKDGEQSQFHGDPLVTDELVIIGTDGNIGHVYAFERSTGAVRWKYRVDERGVASDIVRLEGNVYAVTLGDELVSLDLKSGKPNWTFRAGYSGQDYLTCSSPAATEGQVYFGGLETVSGREGDNLGSDSRPRSVPRHCEATSLPPQHRFRGSSNRFRNGCSAQWTPHRH